ncbi:adhesion G-protein coupled receptor G4 isoform X2 [Hemibagrus wyckioides]|uniref:adhesion G-protein coupled receptor G4 isoform X2 n=1 Tax=Hemibagrus wyckioides TaxID=337641 RepID=UPI00266BD350|nr:adhesion G-protein coupled receptor G4 isoform X2 [Hemibagrus wyckioides]
MPQKYRKLFPGRERTSARLLWLWILIPLIAQADSHFMSNSKAILHGCTDQWILDDKHSVPNLFQMTVCMDLRLLTTGKWMAFSYATPHSSYYDLALHGDSEAVYAWLLGVRHRFPVRLELERWHQLCLRIDTLNNSFILTVNSSQKTSEQRTVITQAIKLKGKLQLGCQSEGTFTGSTTATIELYMFRIWGDVRKHSHCEDGTIVGWDSSMWKISRYEAWAKDRTLYCGEHNNLDCGQR